MSSDEGKPATADGTEDANKEKHVFAAPAPRPPGGGSLLGLDRLAREKRAANQAKESAARKRTSMMEDDELGGGGGNDDDAVLVADDRVARAHDHFATRHHAVALPRLHRRRA